MTEEIIEKCGNLKFTDEEQTEVELALSVEDVIHKRGKLCLIGHFSIQAFKTTMLSIWKPQGRVIFRDVRTNLFIVEFQKQQI